MHIFIHAIPNFFGFFLYFEKNPKLEFLGAKKKHPNIYEKKH